MTGAAYINAIVLVAILTCMILLYLHDSITIGSSIKTHRSSPSQTGDSAPQNDSALLGENHASTAASFWFFFAAFACLLLVYLLNPVSGLDYFHPVLHLIQSVLSNLSNISLLLAAVSYGQGLEFDLRRAIRRIPGYVLLLFLWGIFWEMIVDHRQNFVARALMLAPDVVLANIALVLLGWVFFVRWSRLGNLFVLVAILYALPQLPALLARDLGTFLKPELNLTTIFYVLAGGKVLLAYGFLSLLCSSVLPGIKVNERKLWPADRVPHDFLPSIGRGRVADFILAIVFALIAVPIAEPLWRLIAALVPAQIMH